MATDIRIVHARDFIKATPGGQLDFEESRRVLVEVASASTQLGDFDVLLDTREARVQLSDADLWHLAAELSRLRQPFARRTAVLCPVENFDSAGFFALCAQNRGLRVEAFASFEDAIDWLSGDGERGSGPSCRRADPPGEG